MRQIKFRGKRIKEEDPLERWIEGTFAAWTDSHSRQHTCIVSPNGYHNDVYPETVGQFTGLYDRGGKEIYEGDILSDGEVKYEVWYSEDKAGFIAEIRDPQNDLVDYLGCYDPERMMTVICNIHDNPDQLKGN